MPLKLYAKDNRQLELPISTLKLLNNAIKIKFGLDKCAKATFLCGKSKTA